MVYVHYHLIFLLFITGDVSSQVSRASPYNKSESAENSLSLLIGDSVSPSFCNAMAAETSVSGSVRLLKTCNC